MASTIRIDQVSDPLTVMDKEVYDPTGREEDIFAAVDLKLNTAGPTFTGFMTAPAGTAAAPSIHGVQADTGFHFPTDKVGIAADGSNVFRIGKDDTTVTNDTLLVVARTTAHGAPYFYLRNIDTGTPDGAGPFFGFQSYNDAGVLRDAIQTNGGLQDATAGAEGSSYDIAGYRAGTSEVLFSVNGAEAMVGPGVNNVMDLGRASYAFKAGYFSGRVTAGSVLTAAGTTAIAPWQMTAGTNLTSVTAGAWEYDGTAIYFAHAASSRGVVAVRQIATVQGSKVSLSNSSTSAQNVFASANDVLTVKANTTYRVRGKIKLNTGTTSHTTSFGLGGSATFTNAHLSYISTSSAADTLATPQMRRASVATAVAVTAASTAATTDIWVEGIIRIANAGTVIPQITFSAGPTGTCEVELNSFFELEPIGSDTVAAVGNWA